MGTQKHIDREFFCPISGQQLGNQVVAPHKMAAFQCANGVIFARCPQHVVRVFISDFTTVRMIMDNSIVIQVTEKNPRKEKPA